MIRRILKRRNLFGRAFQYARGVVRNRVARQPVTADTPVVVSLTSHGRRLATVHHTIESIAAGETRPHRLILALDSADDMRAASRLGTLARLKRRGLEIIQVSPMGPHAKYYPYVASVEAHHVPLVTADDDIIYPADWLRGLLKAFEQHPDVIHCYRAHEFGISDGRPALYATWKPVANTRPSYTSFLTGVSGVIYPPAFLNHLRDGGEAFRDVAPRADDVWLHAQSVNAEVRVSQIQPRQRHFPVVLGSQLSALWRHNTGVAEAPLGGGEARTANDLQIEATYSPTLIRRIVDDQQSPAAGGVGARN